jgi:hypothetical protein
LPNAETAFRTEPPDIDKEMENANLVRPRFRLLPGTDIAPHHVCFPRTPFPVGLTWARSMAMFGSVPSTAFPVVVLSLLAEQPAKARQARAVSRA